MVKIKSYLNLILCLSFFSLGMIDCKKTLDLIYAKNTHNPWQLKPGFLHYLKEIFNSNTFIETGTWKGYTARIGGSIFDQVRTIESNRETYEQIKNAVSSEKNITCYYGNSINILPNMIKDSSGNLLFWLNKHYNGGSTDINSAIIEELKIIKTSNIKNAVILIDNIRLFDKSANKSTVKEVSGYPLLQDTYPLLIDINPNYDILLLGDILLAYEKSEEIEPSEVLKAYTLLRINPEAPLDELIKAESIIRQAKSTELATINTLYNHFCIDTGVNPKVYYETLGIGSHFALCYILTLISNNKNKAMELLKGPLSLTIDKKYIDSLTNRIRNNLI